MTTIYTFPSSESEAATYICDGQSTIDEGKSLGFEGTFIIGTLEDANNILQTKKQSMVIPQNVLVVNKIVTKNGIEKTVMCNLDDEPDNEDVQYLIVDASGNLLPGLGLQQAKESFEIIKQNYIDFCMSGLPIILDKWPT
jgi:hypothetical protein